MQFTLRQKILSIFAILLLIFAFIGFQSIRRFKQLGKSIDIILRENYRSVLACQQMKDALERIDSGLLFVLAGFKKQGMEQISQNLARFNEELSIELNNLTLPQEPKEAMALKSLFIKYSDTLNRFLNDHSVVLSDIYFKNLFPLFLKIKTKADTILQMNQENMHEANNRARIKATNARRDMYLFLVFSIMVAVLFMFFSNRWILRPIHRLIESTMEIRNGNLNLFLKVDTQDEIGQLSEAFNAMIASLRVFRRSDQARLVRMQRSTEEVFKSIPGVIAILDADGRVDIATEEARTHFGLTPNTLFSETPYTWLAGLYHEAIKGVGFQKKYMQGIIQHFMNNEERFFQPRAFPILDYENVLAGLIIILEDVTLMKRNDEVRKDLFSTVSHHLKTPLTSIRMVLHLLLEEKIGSINEQQADLIVSARDESERLYGIIEDLLDMSRIEAGNVSMNLTSVSPVELVKPAVETFQRDAQDKGISLEFELPDDLPDIMADRLRIRHVFANLLSNAIKYTSYGGKVKVTAKAERGKVVFLVSDTGRGIPQKFQSRIFDKFFRIPDSTIETGEGLGLSIAKEIIKAHGGEITFKSAEGKGTTFKFSLKRKDSFKMEASDA